MTIEVPIDGFLFINMIDSFLINNMFATLSKKVIKASDNLIVFTEPTYLPILLQTVATSESLAVGADPFRSESSIRSRIISASSRHS